MAIRSHPGVQKMPASGISSELSAHQMAPAGAIAHLRASSLPSCFFPFVFLLRLATPALRLGVLAGSWQRSESYLFLCRNGRRSGQPSSSSLARWGLRPRIAVFAGIPAFLPYDVTGTRLLRDRLLGHPELRKGPLASLEAEGRWQWRSLRPLALPSFVARFALVVRYARCFPFLVSAQ